MRKEAGFDFGCRRRFAVRRDGITYERCAIDPTEGECIVRFDSIACWAAFHDFTFVATKSTKVKKSLSLLEQTTASVCGQENCKCGAVEEHPMSRKPADYRRRCVTFRLRCRSRGVEEQKEVQHSVGKQSVDRIAYPGRKA